MENKKRFIAAVVITLLLAAGGSLYASPFLFTSPQKAATSSQIWSDVDKFISVGKYAQVDFDRWFGAVSFSNGDFPHSTLTRVAQFGFATKLDSLYIAFYYGGNGLNLPLHTYREDADGKKIYTENSSLYLPTTGTSVPYPYNEFSLLLGVADMGFRLSFATDYRSREEKDFAVGTSTLTDYSSFIDEDGSLNPQLAWGMTKALIPNVGLRPHVYLDFDFYRNSTKFDRGSGIEFGGNQIGTVPNPTPPPANEPVYSNFSSNHLGLGLTAAAGGLSLYKDNGFDFGVDLWYFLNFRLFDNQYSTAPGELVDFKGKFRNIQSLPVDPSDLSQGYYILYFFDTDYSNHRLLPEVYASWSDEEKKLALYAKLGLGLTLNSSTISVMDLQPTGAVKQGPETITTTFSFNPTLDLGLQWAIVPEKFFLNVGSKISFLSFDLKSGVTDEYSNDTKGDNTVTDINNSFGQAATELKVGLTFNPTENLGFQAMCGVNTTTNNVSVFDTSASGLAVFSKIIATVKF